MRRYLPEDAHGAGHNYYLVIIMKSSEPLRSLLGYLQPMANYYNTKDNSVNSQIPTEM